MPDSGPAVGAVMETTALLSILTVAQFWLGRLVVRTRVVPAVALKVALPEILSVPRSTIKVPGPRVSEEPPFSASPPQKTWTPEAPALLLADWPLVSLKLLSSQPV